MKSQQKGRVILGLFYPLLVWVRHLGDPQYFNSQIKMPIVKCLSQPRIMAMFLEHSSLYVRTFEILLLSGKRLYSSHERILWKPLQSQVQNTPGISVILISYFSENFLSSIVEIISVNCLSRVIFVLRNCDPGLKELDSSFLKKYHYHFSYSYLSKSIF